MVAKILALVVFMLGAIVALLWVTLEVAGAVTEGADWVWYLALGLIAVPLLAFVILTLRSRTRGMVALTVTATVLLAGVLLTYPDGSVACTPGGGQSASADAPVEGLDAGALLDDDDAAPDAAEAAGDCN